MKDANKFPNLDCRNGWFYSDFTDPSGRRIRRALKTKDIKMARQRLMKIQTDAYEKGFFNIRRPNKVKFPELADKVLEYMRKRKKSFKSYYLNAMRPLRRFFNNQYLCKINKNLIKQYQDERIKEVSGSTINRELALLKRSFNLAIEWELTESNPVRGVEYFKEPKGRTQFLQPDEINLLLEYSPNWLREIIIIAVNTGMRLGELLGLKWQNINLINKIIIIDNTKNNEPREIPTNKIIYELLVNKYKMHAWKTDDFVFTSDRKNSFSASYVSHSFKKAVRKAQLNDTLCMHSLRHTWASHMAMSGVDVLTIKELGGWKTISMVTRYSHLSQQHKREAVRLLENRFLCHKNDANEDLKILKKKAVEENPLKYYNLQSVGR